MNISTSLIADEVLRLINLRYNLLYLYTDFVLKGNINMMHSLARDISMINIIEHTLTDSIDTDVDFEYTDTFVSDTLAKGREYLSAQYLVSYVDYFNDTFACIACPNFQSVIPGIIINNTDIINNIINQGDINNTYYSTDWESQELSVTTLGQTTITGIRLDHTNTDPDTIILEVQGDNPKYTTSGNGYHIANNILYWHDTYRLRPNMQIKLRWKLR